MYRHRDGGDLPLVASSSIAPTNLSVENNAQNPQGVVNGPLTEAPLPLPSSTFLAGVASGLRPYVDPQSLIPSNTPGCDSSRCLAIYAVSHRNAQCLNAILLIHLDCRHSLLVSD